MTENDYYALLGRVHKAADDIVYEANKLQTQTKELGLIYDKGYPGSFEEGAYDKAIINQLRYLHLLLSSIEGNAARLRHIIDDHWTNAENEQ